MFLPSFGIKEIEARATPFVLVLRYFSETFNIVTYACSVRFVLSINFQIDTDLKFKILKLVDAIKLNNFIIENKNRLKTREQIRIT